MNAWIVHERGQGSLKLPQMSNPSSPSAPHGWLIANLLAQIGFGLLAMTVCLPSMPSWSATFGASQATVQLSFSAYLVTYGALQLVYGPLSDRHGRRPVLLFGVALAGVGCDHHIPFITNMGRKGGSNVAAAAVNALAILASTP